MVTALTLCSGADMGGTERRPCCWLLRSEVVGKHAVATFVLSRTACEVVPAWRQDLWRRGTTSEIEVVPQVVPRSAARARRLWSGGYDLRVSRSSRQKRRRAWFEAGVRDLAATFGTLTTSDGVAIPSAYACPLCAVTEPDGRARMKLFTADTLGRLLTVEDVPPRHSGGRPLVLMCKACNSTAGHRIDAAAHRVERSIRTLTRTEVTRGRLLVGGDKVPAEIDMTADGANRITLLGGDPAALGRIAAYFDSLTRTPTTAEPFRLSFSLTDPNDRLAKVSWLKSAYLAAFALLGYRYAMHPSLGAVRHQIQNPQEEHIGQFSFRLPQPLPFSECRVFRISQPDLPVCWGVQMGPILVFLPPGDPDALYRRLAELKAEQASFEFKAENSVWPLAPVFAMAGRKLGGLEKDLALTYGCRNRGAHHLSGGMVINGRFDEVRQSLMNTLFLAVEFVPV
jgi:hypothetical protein